LQADGRSDEALKKIHRLLLERILANQNGVREFSAGAYLHDFRVAVRRTRTGLRQLKGVYPRCQAQHVAGEFRWLSITTGTARDLEVFLASMDPLAAAESVATTDELAPFRAFLRRSERAERRRCTEALEQPRYRLLISEWADFLQQPCGTQDLPRAAQRPTVEVATESIARAYKRLVRRGAEVDLSSPGAAFHRLRLDCKKLRYLLEFFGGLFDQDDIEHLVVALRGTQNSLGAINDLRVQADWIARAPARSAGVRALAECVGDRQHEERRGFVDSFAAFVDDHSRAVMDRLVQGELAD